MSDPAEPAPKRRYLGRQAKAKAAAGPASSTDESPCLRGITALRSDPTALSSVKKWSKGLMQSTDVQSICYDAHAGQETLLSSIGICSSRVHPGLKAMARLGTAGKHKGNVNRDLINFLGCPDTSPFPVMMKVPCAVAKASATLGESSVRVVDIPLMAPHLLLHHLYTTNRHRFNEVFFGCQDAGVLKQFWKM